MSFAILLNSFIIVYSCLSDEATKTLNNPFTNFFVNLVNGFTNKEPEVIKLTGIDIELSKTYEYNNIPGYQEFEIPLGSAKKIDCNFSPIDATDKSITYTAEPADAVQLNRDGSSLSVVGMKAGEVVITAKSNDGDFVSSTAVYVVDTVAPTKYEISLDNANSIALEDRPTIKFDIDGGILGHNELINFRYFDTRKLTYSSSNDVVSVDQNGVIYPNHTGNSKITVSNGDYSKSIDITVSGSKVVPDHSYFEISGSNVCYANDMILNQNNSKKYHYQLTPKNGETAFDPEDFIWSSSNDLLVRVDKHGVMRGFRKSINEDETAIITAKSKYSGVEATYNVTVKNQLPTSMYVHFVVGNDSIWNPTTYTLAVGYNLSQTIEYNPTTQVKNVVVELSDPSVISITNEGNTITLHALKEGTCTIKVTSVVNPDLSVETVYTVVKAGAIPTENITDVGSTIRKSIGHAALFMVAQIFTYLTLYMFCYDKKWCFYSSISLGEGLFLAGLSELIQFFVPTRSGSFIDVLIDFAGVAVGAALTFLGIYLVKKIIEKRKQKENNK